MKGSSEVGHRFLIAAHETFTLLATQPLMGWHCRFQSPSLVELRIFRVSGFERMLVLYLPTNEGVEIVRIIHASRNVAALLGREGLG